MQTLADNSVLMQLSMGLAPKHRKDKAVTAEVSTQKGLAPGAGRWIKDLWPDGAMAPIQKKQGEARAYHDMVTLPFGRRAEEDGEAPAAIAGVGILPKAVIVDYAQKMTLFKAEVEKLVEDFIASPKRWIDWAQSAHNGTFEPSDYPGCSRLSTGEVVLDEAVFKAKMRRRFYLRWDILPVPQAEHFTASVAQILGSDADSVNLRVADAEAEARRELMRRLIEPVKAMAAKLAEQPKAGKDDIIFRDSLVGNVQDIVGLAPKLNITGDPEIDKMVGEVEKLTRYTPDTLRADKTTRAEAAKAAAETLKRLSGYQL